MNVHTCSYRDLANAGIRELTPYQPGKPLEALEREYGIKNGIKLASNENPLGMSPVVKTAIHNVIDKLHYYPDGNAFELKQALSSYLNIHASYLTIGNGSENILELICKAYLNKETNAIISEFAFLTIPILIKSYGAPMKIAPALHYGHNLNAMFSLIDDKTRIIFIVNPNNPTGTYLEYDEIELFLNKVPPDILVVVDEAYYEYQQKTFNYSYETLFQKFPNLILTRTFSKIFSLAGLRLGYGLCSPELTDILNRARLPFNVNTCAMHAGIAALTDQHHVQSSLHLNESGKKQLQQGLEQLNIDHIESKANFITFKTVDPAEITYEKLLRLGIIIRPLHAYGMKHHLRVTIGLPEQNEQFLAALNKVLYGS